MLYYPADWRLQISNDLAHIIPPRGFNEFADVIRPVEMPTG